MLSSADSIISHNLAYVITMIYHDNMIRTQISVDEELYERAKLVTSLQKACQKRPVSADELERLVDRLEKRLQEQVEREVASQRIGDWVMSELVRLDALAAARFASVFRNFENADDYADFFESLARGDS